MNEKVNLKDKTVCIYDHGLFLELGIRIAKDFKRCLYFTPWVSPFPKNNGTLIGAGLEDEGLYRINEFWDHIDEIDLFIFPDVYNSDIQQHLVNMGKRVWGSRKGDELELLRMEAKDHFKKLGLPVQPVREITGLDKLRTYLKSHDNKYIKISIYRGCFETFHAKNYKLAEPILDDLETTLGASQYVTTFIVEDAIDGDDVVETGWDGYTIDGQFPSKSLFGYEQKDCGYLACVKDVADMSPIITEYNEKIAPTLKQYQYRNFMSTEIRVGKDKVAYMTDACMRLGSPPNELYQQMMDNLAEILWEGAGGVLVEPDFNCKYGIEVMIHSDWSDKHYQAIYFPEKIRQWVKLRNLTKINGTYYVVPQEPGLPEIGAVVATGNSIDECIEKVKSYASQIEGYRIDIKVGSIADMNEVMAKGERLGLKFD